MHTVTQLPVAMAMIAALNFSCSSGSSSPNGTTGPGSGNPATPQLPGTFAGKIVFARAQRGTNFIMAMNVDGTGQVNLNVRGFTPHVSPDGRKVAYITPSEGIAVLDLTTGKETIVAPSRLSMAPKWSPDGSKILFWSNRSGGVELYTMNPDGTGVVRLSNGTDGYQEADYSPDGTRIVFRRVYPGSGGGDLWIMNAGGSEPKLLYAATAMQSDPRWSPDGKHIAFVQATGTTAEIFVIDADGSNPVGLTHHPGGDWAPRWSPDGSKIVFFRFASGPNESDIFTVRPDGTGLTPLLEGPTYDHGAVYGPAN